MHALGRFAPNMNDEAEFDDAGDDASNDASSEVSQENIGAPQRPQDYYDDGVYKCSLCHWEVLACSCPGRVSPVLSSADSQPSVVALRNTGIHSGLSELRDSNLLCDITVRVEGKDFACHRMVLWCSSHYFRALFAAGMSDSAVSVVTLDEMSALHFESFLEFCYTGNCNVDRDDLSALAQMAVRLQSAPFEDACDGRLSENVTDETWQDALDFAETLCLPGLRHHSLQRAASLVARGKSLDALLKLDASHLQELARCDTTLLVKLCQCCAKRSVSDAEAALLQSFLDTGAVDVNGSDSSRVTALFEASYFGNQVLVELLIANGANVNLADGDGNSPLFIAAQEGHTGCVDALLGAHAAVEQREKHGATPLFVAVQERQHEIVARLLDANANPDCVRYQDAATPLYIACRSGSSTSAGLLLRAGANVSDRALKTAIIKGRLQCVELLIKAGARCDHIHVDYCWNCPSHQRHDMSALVTRGYEVNHHDEVMCEVMNELLDRVEEEQEEALKRAIVDKRKLLFEDVTMEDLAGDDDDDDEDDFDDEDDDDDGKEDEEEPMEGTVAEEEVKCDVSMVAVEAERQRNTAEDISRDDERRERHRTTIRKHEGHRRKLRALLALAKLMPRRVTGRRREREERGEEKKRRSRR